MRENRRKTDYILDKEVTHMSIGAIGGSTPYASPQAAGKPQGNEELTTVTTKCDKEHAHDPSCPHTVFTRPAPKAGENGYLFDKTV